jgi:hypothetical protein
LTSKPFEFPNLFRRQKSAVSLLLLVDKLVGFAQYSFEKRQAVSCRFSKEFCEYPGNVLTNRKEGIKIQKRMVHPLTIFKRVLQIQKLLVLSGQEFYKFIIIIKVELKNNEYLAYHL